MKPKLSIYSQSTYLIPRTAIEREQKQFIKIAFAVHLSAVISAERYRSDSGALKSAVLTLVYFYIIMIVHKCQQSAAQSCSRTFELRVLPFGKTSGAKLLNFISCHLSEVFPLTVGSGKTMAFENRRGKDQEIGKKVPQAYRVYVEDTFLPCDAVIARIFSKEGNMTNKLSTTNIPGFQGNSYPKAELDYNLDYEYDPAYAHRLIKAGTRYYRYDANGNITAEKDGPFTDEEEFAFTYSYFENEDVYGTDYGFGLDAPKETEQANPQDLFAYRRNYTWNERNLLTKSSDRNFTVHYRYGDDGQRALKYTDEGRSETLYFNNFFTIHIPTQDQNNPQGLRVHKHIFVGNSRLVTAMTHTDNYGDNEEQKAKRYYYHSDHLGSAQFVTDWKGRQYEHIEYTPYGELWIEETAPGIDKLPFRFTGKELDEETGLYYYGARYLDPKYSRWLSGDPALNDYIPKAPIDDEAKKHNENLPGMGGIYNTVNLHVYHYAGNNPVKYVDPDGDKILDVSTTLFQEDGGAEPLGKSNLTISGYGCVLTAYTRIGNAIGISEDITLLSANRTAKNNIFVGENKNLLDRWNSGPKLVNRIGEGSGNMLKFDKSLTDLTLNEYGAALEEYKNSFDTYAVTIRLSSGHTVNMNTDGIIRDNNGNYTIKINNTSNLSTHNAWKPEGMNSDVIDKNVYIERIDVFKVEFNGNFNKNILLPN